MRVQGLLAWLGLWALLMTGCDAPPPSGGDVAETLKSADTLGFERATVPRAFDFPDDHGPHPAFRDEWWYVTGNLDGEAGRRYGFQITFFRHGLRRGRRPGESRWAGQDAWMAHFALSDVAGNRYTSFQRISREAVGLAGGQLNPFQVWLDDWRLEALLGRESTWRFRAGQDGIGIDLELEPRKPPVLQGNHGLSQKSAEVGNASYYYSMTRLAARGTVTAPGRVDPVSGLAWLDREWSTSMLAPDQAGWDWFSLQLNDGSDLMYFRMRRKDGSDDPHSSGAVFDAGGGSRPLALSDVSLRTLATWRSPGGYDYPAGWRLELKPTGQRLVVRPALADQEFRHDARYWEGAVDVTDAGTGQLLGRGYVELTGYAPGAVEKSGD